MIWVNSKVLFFKISIENCAFFFFRTELTLNCRNALAFGFILLTHLYIFVALDIELCVQDRALAVHAKLTKCAPLLFSEDIHIFPNNK